MSHFLVITYLPVHQIGNVKSILPPVMDIEVLHHPDDRLPNLDDVSNKDAVIVLWAGSHREYRRLPVEWLSEFSWKIAVLGEDLSVAAAVDLGRHGFKNVFDIRRDAGAFSSWVIDQMAARGSRSGGHPVESRTLDTILIGDSKASTTLKSLVQKVALRERLTVLILGETGSGKGLVSRAIHEISPRSGGPFIEINCSAIPETLVEAELFGHERGAFTDAHKSRRGIFELAHGGTLFLDEIGFLKQELQVKLLKVLEDKRFRRIGGEKDIQVDCRIIAGTSVDLAKAVADHTFRSDLYYRLNVFPIRVPPLRERREDIPVLAEYFRKYYSQEHGVMSRGFDPKALNWLVSYCWPGNVRELKHTIERAVIVTDDGDIMPEVFSGPEILDETSKEQAVSAVAGDPEMPANEIRIAIPDSGKTLEQIQREVIEKVLEMTDGNRSSASRLLKISRSRLHRKLNLKEEE